MDLDNLEAGGFERAVVRFRPQRHSATRCSTVQRRFEQQLLAVLQSTPVMLALLTPDTCLDIRRNFTTNQVRLLQHGAMRLNRALQAAFIETSRKLKNLVQSCPSRWTVRDPCAMHCDHCDGFAACCSDRRSTGPSSSHGSLRPHGA
jgi:hypothetical protein